MKRKVIIAGCGIGEKDNISLKVYKALKECDTIIYDRLLNPDIIDEFRGKKELIYVGKKSSHHTLSQDEINKLIGEKFKEGKKVVRLKGGDPYVFARGSEEALYLKENGIAFEVYPGLSAGSVVLNAAGIPQTHRNLVTSVTYITGHREKNKEVSFKEYAKLKGTLVFYMGLNNIEKIVNDLLAGGIDKDTNIAIISNGGYNNQKVFKTKINRVLFDIKNKEFLSPTLIVVGKTIGLSDDLNYFERRPLFNKNVLITRSFKDSLILSERLKNLGANVINAPTFTIEPINLDILEKDIDNFSYDYLIFTSVNSVRIFFETLLKKYDIRKIGNVKIAAIGSKCKEVIEKYNLKVSFYSREGVAEKLYEKLFSIMRKEDRVYLPHSSLTRAYIIKKMKEKSNLRELTIYDNKIVREKVKFRGKIDLALFMSSSSVNNFIEVYGKEALDGAKIFSIGNITTQTLKNKGIGEILQADIASSESLLERIEEYYEDEKN
ncbi:MAG: uroporphyrinogen-III C-methyltransferase [Peptoniphilaceae bacterium]|nr:uroporphyrinogen-III C-methyltransferase [Peptoniphilaceae bacterium]